MLVWCVLSLILLCLFSPVPVRVFGDFPVTGCQWEYKPTDGEASKQTFNFAPLSFNKDKTYLGHNNWGGWWSETCTTDECPADQKQYEYLFNICGNTLQKPNVGDKCADLKSSDISAYQYNITADECYAIGQSTKQFADLLVPGKPSQGFKLRYASDSGCSGDRHRQLTINVRCSVNLPAQPQLNYDNNNQFKTSSSSDGECKFKQDCDIDTGDVTENSTCDYIVNLDTVFGCPSSCLADNLPCSNHGICAEDNSVTRCFCDVGYGGDKCQLTVDTSSTSSRNPNTVLAVFVLILLFAALGLGYALYRKIRGFHGDYDHQYGQLSDGAKQARGMSVNA